MMIQTPIELEPGYMEFRVKWSTSDLMAMTGEQLDRFKELMAGFEALDREVKDA